MHIDTGVYVYIYIYGCMTTLYTYMYIYRYMCKSIYVNIFVYIPHVYLHGVRMDNLPIHARRPTEPDFHSTPPKPAWWKRSELTVED